MHQHYLLYINPHLYQLGSVHRHLVLQEPLLAVQAWPQSPHSEHIRCHQMHSFHLWRTSICPGHITHGQNVTQLASTSQTAAKQRSSRRRAVACLPWSQLRHPDLTPVSQPANEPPSDTKTKHTHGAACSPTGILGLGQLATPSSLQQAWTQDVLPACVSAWEVLLQDTEQLQLQLSQPQGGLAMQQTEQLLLQLDALLGTCQQVRHRTHEWAFHG
jgi:hypothetical protein